MSYRYLDYEENFLIETFNESVLLIAGSGMGLERIFCRHLELYSDAKVLALVLGCDARQHKLFCRWLRERGVGEPKRLDSSFATAERTNVYLEGGVKFVTTNIFVNDIMADRVPLQLLTCALVYKADALFTSALDAFLLNKIRQTNNNCLVKAFSDRPTAFTRGFGKLQRAVTLLQVDGVRFLPRFHVGVIKSLEGGSSVEEFQIQMDKPLRHAQFLLRNLISACVQELKQCAADQLPAELIQLDAASCSWFESSLKKHLGAELDDILSPKALQLIADIGQFRYLVTCLESRSGVTFAKALNSLFTKKKTFHNNCGWLFTDTAQELYKSVSKIEDQLPGKLEALLTILDELYADQEAKRCSFIFVADDQAIEFLLENLSTLWCQRFVCAPAIENGFDTVRWDQIQSDKSSIFIINTKHRTTVLTALYAAHPSCAIVYSADLWLLRQLEVYGVSALNRSAALKVCFLMYVDSMEEERYLTAVREERLQFEVLFKEELSVVVTKLDETGDDQVDSEQKESMIVVDMREFRSDLPTNLYLRGVRVFPATLTIGDYVLSPTICVERKAVNDLIGSLLHGRLYGQCESMFAHYRQPILLIQLENYKRSWRRLGDRLLAKLVCLTMKFPNLNILWGAGSLSIANLFLELKWNRAQPNHEEAVLAGRRTANDANGTTDDCNIGRWIRPALRCLPGMGERQESKLMSQKTLTLRQLMLMDEGKLCNLANVDKVGKEWYSLFSTNFQQQADCLSSKKLKMDKS